MTFGSTLIRILANDIRRKNMKEKSKGEQCCLQGKKEGRQDVKGSEKVKYMQILIYAMGKY